MVRGEIYLAELKGYVGSEQQGLRPVVVIQNDIGNKFAPTTVIIPLTSKHKPILPTHLLLTPDDCGISQKSTVLCEQLRVVDKSRLTKLIGRIVDGSKIDQINQCLIIALGLGE
jgi:mRNA interferase MazF